MDDDNITAELPAVPTQKDPNQGEGDKVSGAKYDADAQAFVAAGKVEPAAREAKAYVDSDPVGAAAAEREAKHGPPHHVSMEELVAKGRTVIDRVVDKVKTAIKK